MNRITDAREPREGDVAQAIFEAFFDFSPDAIVVIDAAGRIVNVNSQAEQLFGYSEADLLGRPVEVLMPERFRAAHPSHREDYGRHAVVRPMGKGLGLYGKHKDGLEFPVDIMLSPVETAGGRLFLSVIRDVSEKKRVDEELRQLIDVIPQQVFVFDSDWSPLFANQRELEYTGLTLHDVQSKDAIAKIFHPDDLPKLVALREQALIDGAPFEMEARIRGRSGEYRWFLIRDNPFRDEHGRVVRWYGTRTDIEDRKRAEEQSRLSEEALRQLIDVIPQQVLVFDPDWNPLFVNQRELDYTGLPPQMLPTKESLSYWLHPDDLRTVERAREQALVDSLPFELEARVRGRDGEYRWFLIRNSPMKDEHGRVLRWYVSRTDIEDRKRAEEAWHEAQAELRHITRVTTLGELATSIAHEVSQPLTAILGNADACRLLLDRSNPNLDELRNALEKILRDSRRASDVTQRVRALASKNYEKTAVDANDAVREVLALLLHELSIHGVVLRLELASGLPDVFADRVQLQQVILNLVINGIESMQSVADRPRELEIRSQLDDGGQILLSVKDTGPGFATLETNQLFEPFYTTKSNGMGMGLAICRSIIEAHGGRLSASTNAELGATFQFTLPLVLSAG